MLLRSIPFGATRRLRAITIGPGASGLNVARIVGAFMKNVDLQLYEKNEDVGGTWLENRYLGCACDIPSSNHQYIGSLIYIRTSGKCFKSKQVVKTKWARLNLYI